jgi:hypothetical protein
MSSKITRSDIYVRDEKGPEWFNDFLQSLAGQSITQNVLDAINKKRGETVEGVVSKYREMVGLDVLADDGENEINKEASVRPLSSRHAKMMTRDPDDESIVVIIEKDPKLKADFESILKGSGGTRNTHAIIHFLRKMLGSEMVSYSDDQLIQYIDDMKGKYYDGKADDPPGNIGHVGTESSDTYNDHVADFIEHGKGK